MAIRHRRIRHSNHKSNTCPPGWAWLLAGILIGMFFSFLIYLREIAPHTLPPESVITIPPPSIEQTQAIHPITQPSVKAENTESSKDLIDGFKFYDILPNAEVEIPSTISTPAKTTESDSEVDLSTTVPGQYLLQVGSFKNKHEAEGLKTYLVSLGILATIEETILNETEYWYQVRVGPFTDLNKLNQTRTLLAENHISTILLKF